LPRLVLKLVMVIQQKPAEESRGEETSRSTRS
jgi:hypothetical protein